MADKIQFTFTSDNNKTLVIGKNEFGIVDYSGIESAEYEFSTEERINGFGSVLKRRKIPERDISITAEYKNREIGKSETRELLISFFTPFATGNLMVECAGRKRNISYEVESFRYKQTNIHDRLLFQIELVCFDPSFKSVSAYSKLITTLIGGWKWKFKLPFKMKQYGPLMRNVYNGGHMETPVEIYFKGPAEHPKIMNHRTGTYIQVKGSLNINETLYISTMYGELAVEIISAGERIDAWDRLEEESDFFRLQPGDNMIEYSNELKDAKPQGVEIRYRERYLGV